MSENLKILEDGKVEIRDGENVLRFDPLVFSGDKSAVLTGEQANAHTDEDTALAFYNDYLVGNGVRTHGMGQGVTLECQAEKSLLNLPNREALARVLQSLDANELRTFKEHLISMTPNISPAMLDSEFAVAQTLKISPRCNNEFGKKIVTGKSS